MAEVPVEDEFAELLDKHFITIAGARVSFGDTREIWIGPPEKREKRWKRYEATLYVLPTFSTKEDPRRWSKIIDATRRELRNRVQSQILEDQELEARGELV